MKMKLVFVLMASLATSVGWSQGQDSTEQERDLMVIGEMLPGIYNNVNQVYFDGRLQRPNQHPRVHIEIERLETGPHQFRVSEYWSSPPDQPDVVRLLRLSVDQDEAAVRLDVNRLNPEQTELLDAEGAFPELPTDQCGYLWAREAGQFRARASAECDDRDAHLLLSRTELWISPLAPPDGDTSPEPYKLHRARPFECYVDIPGVGGGRDIPYKRYGNYEIHDRGGNFSFQTDKGEPRTIDITLFHVDWPLNNYEGVFTRDSLVIYVNETKADGERIQHGYSFTTPLADRVGINLKWALAYCYMESNESARPSM